MTYAKFALNFEKMSVGTHVVRHKKSSAQFLFPLDPINSFH